MEHSSIKLFEKFSYFICNHLRHPMNFLWDTDQHELKNYEKSSTDYADSHRLKGIEKRKYLNKICVNLRNLRFFNPN